MNNYFSLGADALVALDFHESRGIRNKFMRHQSENKDYACVYSLETFKKYAFKEYAARIDETRIDFTEHRDNSFGT